VVATLAHIGRLQPGDHRIIHVADDRTVHFGIEKEGVEIAPSHAAASDQCNADPVVGPTPV
jgi:hypothetical protein